MKKLSGIILLLTVLISLCPIASAQDSPYYLTGATFICGTPRDTELFINMAQNNDIEAQNGMLMAQRCVAVSLGAAKLPVYLIESSHRSLVAKIRLKGATDTVYTHKGFVLAR
jgi:hypothetical protein